jgi:hypothetical protein
VFYFEQLLQTSLNGIDGTGIMTAVLQIAGTILIATLLVALYQAYARGGDVRVLATAAVTYLILGLIFAQYGTVFRGINTMFNSVADSIYSQSGAGDVFKTWLDQLQTYMTSSGTDSLWSLTTGGIAGVLTTVLILVGLVILPITYVLFTLFYTMYGSVLYVMGPFVLALLPARGIGQIARTYAVNVMVFQAWGLIYAILQVLMSAVNLGSMDAVLNSNGILNGFVGSSQMILLGVMSILFSLSIALIPVIASRLVRGDVGSAVFATMTAAYTASQVATAAAIGAIGGGQAGLATGAGSVSGTSQLNSTTSPRRTTGSAPFGGGGTQGAAAAQGTAGRSPSRPSASQPQQGAPSSSPGQFRGYNIPHAAGWGSAYLAGWAVGKTLKAIRS